ncbi:MAG: Ldh family oxidoreductase [Bacillota bacterium]
MPEEQVALTSSQLQQMALMLCTAAGIPQQEAEIFVDTLLSADLEGVSSHGVVRLPAFLRRIRSGSISVPSPLRWVSQHGALALLDAGNGLGQVAAHAAMKWAIDKAERVGLAAVSVRNSNHFGRGAYYARMASDAGMIGLAFTNASPRLAPTGASVPFLGNNPWALAVPSHGGSPIIVDMACSIVSAGSIRLALRERRTIPPGWALDRRGRPTTDPAAALEGTLLPVGGYKGYAMSLAVSILTAFLAGGAWDREVAPIDDLNKPQRVSHFLACIDPGWIGSRAEFSRRLAMFADTVRRLPAAEGMDGPRLPGDRAAAERSRRLNDGIPLSRELLRQLRDLAQELGEGHRFEVLVNEGSGREGSAL